MTNRFKGLDLIDRVHEELCTEAHGIVQQAEIKIIPKKRNAKRQNGCLKKPDKQLRKEKKPKARRKGKIYLFECRVSKNSKER